MGRDMRAKFKATIAVYEQQLVLTDTQSKALAEFLAQFEGKAVTVEISKPASTRSLRQNAYYWGVVLTFIAQETGHSTEEIHLAVKDMFLPRKFIALGSREVEIRKTTTDLTPTEFSSYIEQVRAWAATELNCSIPSPNE